MEAVARAYRGSGRLASAVASGSQTMRLLWRVLNREVTWSNLHFRIISPAAMFTLYLGEIVGKGIQWKQRI